jgi:hypothetical protein
MHDATLEQPTELLEHMTIIQSIYCGFAITHIVTSKAFRQSPSQPIAAQATATSSIGGWATRIGVPRFLVS